MDPKARRFKEFEALLASAQKRFSPHAIARIEEAFAVASGKRPPPPHHPYQNDTFCFSGLETKPWYDPARFEQVKILLDAAPTIRREALAVRDRKIGFRRHSQGSAPHVGSWTVGFIKGLREISDEDRALWPETARIVETLPRIAQLAMFSALNPGCVIKPHCGPWNANLTIHLPLVVPEGDCALQVGGEARRWKEGECLVFDDSFEHEAWNRTDTTRLILLVDIWHPDLTDEEAEVMQSISDLMVQQARYETSKKDSFDGQRWWV